MGFKRLFILLEGDDDERFFENIINRIMIIKYNHIKIWKYAHIKKDKIKQFIRSIDAMKAEYIFVADFNSEVCIAKKKYKINECNNVINNKNIIIVKKEIESWYLAGIDDILTKRFKIDYENTDKINKEQFNSLIPKNYNRIDFMLEIIKRFDLQKAIERNNSLQYFINKYA